jgi:hypothetical protein
VCPACGSLERHRLLWLYLRARGDLFEQRLRVLHLAPEPCVEWRLGSRPNLDYITADLEPGAAAVAADLERLPFPDGSFHRVLCIHVLEHVRDDAAADAGADRAPPPDPAGGRPDDPNFTDGYVGVRPAGPEPPPPS